MAPSKKTKTPKASKAEKSKSKSKSPSKSKSSKKDSKTSTKRIKFRHKVKHLFAHNKKEYGIGQNIQKPRDLTRYVKWPRVVRVQRQRSILKRRLKVPPALNEFTKTLDRNQAANVFRLLAKYRPESKAEKKDRLKKVAELEAAGKEAKQGPKPLFVKFGINHVTDLIESRKAKLVVVSHDVDPIELVVFLPALCRKMNVPFAIVKGKSRLGRLIHQKTATAVALCDIRKEDQAALDQITEVVSSMYAEKERTWGGGIMGAKSQAVQRAKRKAAAEELAKLRA